MGAELYERIRSAQQNIRLVHSTVDVAAHLALVYEALEIIFRPPVNDESATYATADTGVEQLAYMVANTMVEWADDHMRIDVPSYNRLIQLTKLYKQARE